MPFIDMYVKQGLSDLQIRKTVESVTAAVAGNLENTLPRMVRISVYELPENCCYAQGERAPSLKLQLGPGRSDEAVARCIEAVVSAVHESMDIPKEEVRFYVERVPGENFAIGGKLKNFNEKVKT